MLIGCDMTKRDKTKENNEQRRKRQSRGRHKAPKKSRSKVRQPLRQFISAIGEYKIPPPPFIFLSFSHTRGRDLQCLKQGAKSSSLEWDGCVKLKRGYKCKVWKNQPAGWQSLRRRQWVVLIRVLRNINDLPEKNSQSSPLKLSTYQKHQKHIKNTVWVICSSFPLNQNKVHNSLTILDTTFKFLSPTLPSIFILNEKRKKRKETQTLCQWRTFHGGYPTY